jgi:3-oxoacyl-[acyl-carrier-protein] synthase I
MNMPEVYIGAHNIISSLGFTTDENAENMLNGISGIRIIEDENIYPAPLSVSLTDKDRLHRLFEDYKESYHNHIPAGGFTCLEKMILLSLHDVLSRSKIDPRDPGTIFILSTTKGNIDLLEKEKKNSFDTSRLYLWKMAEIIGKHLGLVNRPLIVSNACISGLLAIIVGERLIRSGKYDHAIIAGGDLTSEFVISGFQSFQSLSPGICKPFDLDRDGLSLGEGSGALLLSRKAELAGTDEPIIISGGNSNNDANHISGPSREGEGLYLSISGAMEQAGISPDELDYISAHGTATPYNDEMEAKAINRAGLKRVPLNSYKAYIGHTLGAAGIIESALTLHSMSKSQLIASAAYHKHGVSLPLNIIRENKKKDIKQALKIASGFGGCNAAAVFKKI